MEQWSHCMLDRPAPGNDVVLQDKDKFSRAFDVFAVSPATKVQHCGIGHRIQITVCRDKNGHNSSAAICGQKRMFNFILEQMANHVIHGTAPNNTCSRT